MSYFVHYQIGMDKWDMDTPALLLDIDVMEKNISEMARYTKSVGTNLRPHVKNHMCPIIAHKQMEAGAIGLCCQTIGEAEILAAWGVRDITICNEIVGTSKIKRLMGLKGYTDVMVCVDNTKNVEDLAEAASATGHELHVLIDLNTGYDRCGVEPGTPALKLAQEVSRSRGLRFRGVQGYTPMHEKDPEKRRVRQESMLKTATDTKDLLEKSGIPVDIVSAGCTSCYDIAAEYPGITEIQPGTYVMMDINNSEIVGTTPADLHYALTVLTTVISKPTEDRAVVDAGNKALATERSVAKDLIGVGLYRLAAEHGRIGLENPSKPIEVGDKIEFIVSYCDGTVNRWNKYYVIRNGGLEAVWDIHHYHQ